MWHATELKETPSPSLFLLPGSLLKGHSPPHTRSLHICSPAEATGQDPQYRGDQLKTPQAGLQGEANKVPVGPRLSGRDRTWRNQVLESSLTLPPEPQFPHL